MANPGLSGFSLALRGPLPKSKIKIKQLGFSRHLVHPVPFGLYLLFIYINSLIMILSPPDWCFPLSKYHVLTTQINAQIVLFRECLRRNVKYFISALSIPPNKFGLA